MIDEDAVVRLLVSKRPTIVAYAMSIVFSLDLAEEIYQNVVVVVLRKRKEIDESRDVLVWVLGVTRVESLLALRQRGNAPHALGEAALELLDESWRDRASAASAETDASEALRHCLLKLTDRSRSVLRLRYVEGISGEKLAKRLGVKLNTAYVTVARIHRQLRACIDARQSRTRRGVDRVV